MNKLLILFAIALSFYSTFHQQNFVQSHSVSTDEEDGELVNLDQNTSRTENVSNPDVIWQLGEIPYEIDSSINAKQNCAIHSVLYNVMFNSCIRFRPKRTSDRSYLSISRNLACGTVALGHGEQTVREDGFRYTFVCYTNLKAADLLSSNLSTLNSIPQSTQVEYVRIDDDDDDEVQVEKQHNLLLEKFDFNSIMNNILNWFGGNATLSSINQLYQCPVRMQTSLQLIQQFVRQNSNCNHKSNSVRTFEYSKVLKKSHKRSLSRRSVTSKAHITEKLVQGDILIRRKSSNVSYNNNNNKTRTVQNSAVADDAQLWPGGVIPYKMVSSLRKYRCLVESAMLQIMLNSCVRFKRKTRADNFYARLFQNGTGCYSSVGFDDRYREAAKVSLPEGCLNIGTVVHELLHTVGFYHHQNRQDRKDYLRILWDNIDADYVDNYRIVTPDKGKLVTDFDFDSVMLYGERGLAKNGHNITMKAKVEGVQLPEVSDKPGLSLLDALAIRRLYQCAPNSRQMQSYYENPYVLESFGELVKSCPPDSPLSLYTFLGNN